MATLYDTSAKMRRGLIMALIFVIVVLSFDTIGRYLTSANNPFLQVPSFYLDPDPIQPEIEIPKIPSIAIAEESKPVFTVEGVYPTSPDTVLVYSIEKPREKLNTVDDAVNTANALGFDGTPVRSNAGILLWQNSQQTRSLQFNTQTQNWRMRTQYFRDQRALQPKTLQSAIKFYEDLGRNIATSLGFRDRSLQQGITTAKYAKLGNDGLFTNPVSGAQSSDYVVMDVHRELPLAILKPENLRPDVLKQFPVPPELDGKVYKTNPVIGSLHMVISNRGSGEEGDIYELDFDNFEYNYTFSVMLAKSAAEAWSSVQSGKEALVSLKLRTADYFSPSQSLSVVKFALDAKATEIAYWEPTDWDGFLYPIYIFRGRAELSGGRTADFVFYADALKRF